MLISAEEALDAALARILTPIKQLKKRLEDRLDDLTAAAWQHLGADATDPEIELDHRGLAGVDRARTRRRCEIRRMDGDSGNEGEDASVGPPQLSGVSDFKISFMAPEGTEVAEGEPVLGFDTTRLHYDLARRYTDRSFCEMVGRLPFDKALQLYEQVFVRQQGQLNVFELVGVMPAPDQPESD